MSSKSAVRFDRDDSCEGADPGHITRRTQSGKDRSGLASSINDAILMEVDVHFLRAATSGVSNFCETMSKSGGFYRR